MAYLIAFLALAAIPFALAAYGGHMAAIALEGKARRRALITVWTLAAIGVALSGLQQYMAWQSDTKRDAESSGMAKRLENIDNGVLELRHVTQAKPGDPPEKVLAAAAAKILELDAKTKQLEAGVKDITATRRLDNKQKSILLKTLKAYNFERKIDLLWVIDSESLTYANDLYLVFEEAKAVNMRSEMPQQFNPGANPKGLIILVKNVTQQPKEVIYLVEAFNKAKIQYTIASSNNVTNLITIIVGFKR